MSDVADAEPSTCAECGKLLGRGEGRSAAAGTLCGRCDAERRPVLTLQSRDLLLGIALGMVCGCFAFIPLLLRRERSHSMTIGVIAGALTQIVGVLIAVGIVLSLWSWSG